MRWSFIAADLKASSWQIALLDDAATVMDVDFLSDASNIYRHQHMYDSCVNSLVEALDDDVLLIERDVRSANKMHATRVMLLDNFSRQLKADYDAFLQKHGAAAAAGGGGK